MDLPHDRRWLNVAGAAAAVLVAYVVWSALSTRELPPDIASGNGRIEAVEIDVATKAPGRIKDILVHEGDFVEAGQVLARMDTDQLEAQMRQAEAQLKRARIGIETARSLVSQREAEHAAAAAIIEQRQAQLDAAQRKLARSADLLKRDTVSQQVYDDDLASERSARAGVAAAQAQLAAASAAIGAAKATVIDADAAIEAAKAALASIKVEIDDSTLRSPRPGRVQYRVAEPGEVLAAGGRLVSLVDLSDVHMTFFLPTGQAGRLAIGSEARIVLDAAPQYVIPASISFVSDVAQFTPKTVETEEERQKLMFRIKARIPPELLRKHIRQVKTGLPGVTYVRLGTATKWPEKLAKTVQ